MDQPRKPTQEELDALEAQVILDLEELWGPFSFWVRVKEAKRLVREAHITVFDGYCVGDPHGHLPCFGPLMVVLWPPSWSGEDFSSVTFITWMDGSLDLMHSYGLGESHDGVLLPEYEKKVYQKHLAEG